MTSVRATLEQLRINPNWAKLPLFDRSKWKRVRFGDVVENLNETERDPAGAGIERFIGMEHLEPGSLHIREWGNVADGTTFNRRCRPGQVLFGKRRAYQRKVAVAEFDAVVSGDIYVFAPKDERLIPELLPFLCLSEEFFEFAVETSAGSLSPRTNWSHLTEFEFDLPARAEQRKFAELLWAVDELVKSYETECMALKNYQAMTWASNTRKKDARMVALSEVAVVSNGSTPSKAEDKYWAGGTVPWLPTGKVHDRFIREADEFITETAIREKKARIFPKGSVLVAMIGQGKTRGSAALLEIDASINQNFACVIPKKIDSSYLFYALSFSYESLRRSSHGSNQEALNCGLVSAFPIPLVAEDEQRKIGRRLRKMDTLIYQMDERLMQSQALLTKLINTPFS